MEGVPQEARPQVTEGCGGRRFRLGLIVNPVAGIGGKVGLKGSDGEEIFRKALDLGAKPESGDKAVAALQALQSAADGIEILSVAGAMGGDALKACGLSATIVGGADTGRTGPEDTRRAAQAMRDAGADLLLFAGGDGTARDIMDAVGTAVPALGIPAGCKIHSAVYAITPRRAGELAARCAAGAVRSYREAEVMDIDEELFRQNRVQARLYGYLRVPEERGFVQSMKSGRGMSPAASLTGMACHVADAMEKDTLYIVGPGTTTRAVMERLGLPNTLLGVDLVVNGALVCADATERDILDALGLFAKRELIVTVIGGQGHVFGRGNRQLSAAVIRAVGRENIIIVASRDKMDALLGQSLYTDTGDASLDDALSGYWRVTVGDGDFVMARMTN